MFQVSDIMYKKIVNSIKTKNVDTLFSENKLIKVLLYCSWCSSKELCDLWNKMSKGNYSWNNIQIVSEEPCDYYCIILWFVIIIIVTSSIILLNYYE